MIWEKLVVYVNDFNLSNQEKSRLILRLFDDVKLVFDKVPLSILVNDIFLKDFFMKQPDFAKWYFYQLLKSYEGEQMYLNELGYVYGDEEKTDEVKQKFLDELILSGLSKNPEDDNYYETYYRLVYRRLEYGKKYFKDHIEEDYFKDEDIEKAFELCSELCLS